VERFGHEELITGWPWSTRKYTKEHFTLGQHKAAYAEAMTWFDSVFLGYHPRPRLLWRR
jgi:hypothetical protein